MKLRINPEVVKDLKVIRKYIAEDSPEAAQKTINQMYDRFEKLLVFPNMGADLSTIVSFSTDYRYVISGEYIILYKLDDECISIYRVLNSKRDMVSILFN